MAKTTRTFPQERGDLAGDPGPERYEKLYKMLLASIPSSVLLVDTQLRIASANQNFRTKARVRDDVIGQRLEDIFPPVIYEHMNLKLRITDVFRAGKAVQGERLVYRAPGLPTRTYYYSLIPFKWKETIEYVMLLMEDVTEKVRLGEEVRQAERRLASVVESASDMVVSTDVAGFVLTWNSAASKITGYGEGEVRHQHLCDLCREDQRAAMGDVHRRVAAEGRTLPIEVELVSRQGETVPIAWVLSPMRDDDGRVIGLVAVGRDLTERRKFQAKLLQSEKLAALGVMAGGIAHEIRNPLAVISSAAQLLVEKPLSKEVQQECAEKAYEATRRASNIIESLLRFARPADKGAMKLLDFVEIVDESLKLVANQLKLSKIECQVQHPGEPLLVSGNASLLQQLVTNLLLNAANSMDEDGGTIELSLSRTHEQAELRVTDTGRGIPSGDLDKVFDPFFTTMPVGKGTGLGLSISYAIVQQHGGRIDITSERGAGTVVSVILPFDLAGASR